MGPIPRYSSTCPDSSGSLPTVGVDLLKNLNPVEKTAVLSFGPRSRETRQPVAPFSNDPETLRQHVDDGLIERSATPALFPFKRGGEFLR
jgi:hypothetical protein